MSFSGISAWVVAAALLATGCANSDVSRAIGARCDTDRECDDRCLTGGDFPGGFCSLQCRSDNDCPSDTRCATDRAVCMVACSKDSDCDYLGSRWGCHTQPNTSGKVCRGD